MRRRRTDSRATGSRATGSRATGSRAYAGPYPPYGPYGYQQPTNGKATGALWTGVGALVLVFCCGAGILGLVPIVLGVMARGEIRRNGGQQGGDGMAIAGIVMGSIAVVLSIAFIVLIVIGLSTGSSTFDRYDQGGV